MKHLIGSLILTAALVTGASLPTGEAGLSKERLARIAPALQKHIDANRLPGAVALIVRNGKVAYFESFGNMDVESKKTMPKDAIFRIYSMTKAVTGVAVMMLHEEGRFFLNDPVSKYLPEFENMRVAVERTDGGTRRSTHSVPAERPITIRDLLRHTSGLDYTGPNDENGKSVYQQLNVMDPNIDLAEAIRRLAKAPLVRQPGSTWIYGLSIDVLARLVEVVADQPVERFFEERIFRPLGMTDTGYYAPESKWNRLVTLYAPSKEGPVTRFTGSAQDSYKKRPSATYGGHGLVSTAMDYARFCQMLLNGGELEGKRLLSRKSVELMSTDHLGDLPRDGTGVQPGYGFGLTFAVNLDPGKSGALGSKGTYSWGGAAGTAFWIDPQEKLVGVLMLNILPPNFQYGNLFRQLAYQAIGD